MWFYKVNKDLIHNKLIVRWNTLMTYLTKIIGFLGVMFCFTNLLIPAIICLSSLALLLAYYLFKHGTLVQLLHSQERIQKLDYYGSRYSFKNPLVVSIPLPKSLR